MKEYYLTHWFDHGQELLVVRQAKDILSLYDLLLKEFDEEVLINGFNYNYITIASHFAGAGFPITEPSLKINLSPAHINKNFFYILNIRNI